MSSSLRLTDWNATALCLFFSQTFSRKENTASREIFKTLNIRAYQTKVQELSTLWPASGLLRSLFSMTNVAALESMRVRLLVVFNGYNVFFSASCCSCICALIAVSLLEEMNKLHLKLASFRVIIVDPRVGYRKFCSIFLDYAPRPII